MPELPEVETVCRGLDASLKEDKITEIIWYRPSLRLPIPPHLKDVLLGMHIARVERHAKYICMVTKEKAVLLMHLGMSGKITVHASTPVMRQTHDHLVIDFASGKQLVFNDARRFGLIALTDTEKLATHPLLRSLGIEPLTEAFDANYLVVPKKPRLRVFELK